MAAIPKTIWMLWLQGWDSAPEIVGACARSWRVLNPGWDVRQLSRADVRRLFPRRTPQGRFLGLPAEALSDLVRLEVLAGHGGVWVDATTYCLKPLDDWLGGAAAQGFFAFNRPSPYRMLAAWFLAAAPAHPVLQRWRASARAYWADRRERDAYFWLDYLFAEAYAADPDVRRAWDVVPKFSADGPRAFYPYEDHLFCPVTEAARAVVEDAAAPLLKLTHKLDPAVIGRPGTLYRWLCERSPAREDLNALAPESRRRLRGT